MERDYYCFTGEELSPDSGRNWLTPQSVYFDDQPEETEEENVTQELTCDFATAGTADELPQENSDSTNNDDNVICDNESAEDDEQTEDSTYETEDDIGDERRDVTDTGAETDDSSIEAEEQAEAASQQRWGSRDFDIDDEGRAAYQVKQADTLWLVACDVLRGRIGRQPLSQEVVGEVERISHLNRLANPHRIVPGTMLRIPPESGSPPSQYSVPPLDIDTPPKPMAPWNHPQQSIQQVYVDQMRDGRDWFACGPTSLQMALVAHGAADRSESTRQALIRETGTNRATGLPGSADLLAQAARRHGLDSQYYPTNSVDALDQVLSQGKNAIVNGGMPTRAGGVVGHFIFVMNKRPDGTYVVGDPASPGNHVWTRQQLAAFMTRPNHPPGFASVGRKR